MAIDPALHVIAVFGSNEPSDGELKAAGLLGGAINLAGAVLLTGGKGKSPGKVKDAAIIALKKAETGRPPTWIGVANKPKAAPPKWRGEQAVVVTPGWGDRRNFVEACLCDAALVLGGSSGGTASEALFCLYLRRPVLVVGDRSESKVDARSLKKLALKKITKPDQNPLSAIDLGILRAYQWADNANADAEVMHLPEDSSAARKLLRQVQDRIQRPSPRPEIDQLRNESAWNDYVRTCLDEIDR